MVVSKGGKEFLILKAIKNLKFHMNIIIFFCTSQSSRIATWYKVVLKR
jgi:hypothetical protein